MPGIALRTPVIDSRRTHSLNSCRKTGEGPVIYWMTRDKRIDDNWAVLYMLELCRNSHAKPLILYIFTPEQFQAADRKFDFIIRGLMDVEKRARELGIPFIAVAAESPGDQISLLVEETDASAVICDFYPLREYQLQQTITAGKVHIPVIEVDSHNVIPSRSLSSRQEYSAGTIRRKIEKLLPEFLCEIPSVEEYMTGELRGNAIGEAIPWNLFRDQHKGVTTSKLRIPPNPGIFPAGEVLSGFINERLGKYDAQRNDPNANAQSGLSPYLNTGQLSAQSAAVKAAMAIGGLPLKGGFLDELIVRRELSDNYCLYNPYYDSYTGFPEWARNSLEAHRKDPRDYLYSLQTLETAETHEELWNAAQVQLLETGTMHGYMRMYWAKKILEWSPDAGEALRRAIYLNDTYALDGLDPNGYAGCAWAIGGLHDRAWSERPVYGKIRYMNENGCRRKFDADKYIERFIEMPAGCI